MRSFLLFGHTFSRRDRYDGKRVWPIGGKHEPKITKMAGLHLRLCDWRPDLYAGAVFDVLLRAVDG